MPPVLGSAHGRSSRDGCRSWGGGQFAKKRQTQHDLLVSAGVVVIACTCRRSADAVKVFGSGDDRSGSPAENGRLGDPERVYVPHSRG